jgi:chaperonin GroEL
LRIIKDMNTNKRVVASGKDAHEKLIAGANKLADIVTSTLGPGGRNVIIGVKGGVPVITNDGVSIAKEIFFEDEIEDLGARTIREVAQQTNGEVGDGTTTSITLAQAIIKTGYDLIYPKGKGLLGQSNNVNVINIKRQIDKECEFLCKKLEESATPINTKEELYNVARVSSEHDKIAEAVSETLWSVGKDGFVTFEEGYDSLISFETINGMRLPAGYAAEFMAGPHNTTIIPGAHIVITNHVIQSIGADQDNWLVKLSMELNKRGSKQLVIVAQTFSDEVMGLFYANTAFQVVGIRAPWAYQNEILQDLAAYTGARFIDQELQELESITINDVGLAECVTVRKNETAFIGGQGMSEEYVDKLVEKMNSEEDTNTKKRYKDRIARLAGKIGIIKVGAPSLTERKYLIDKIEDTIHATRAAWQDGVVRGGGLALDDLARDLQAEFPNATLLEAIQAPYKKIQENAGGTILIGEEIVDPVRVTRTALQKACSVAGIFITASAAINTKNKKEEDEE